MSVQNDSPHAREAAAPVFLPEAFLGREGLVRNMLWRLKRGESLSLCGGPKLGKTSLLLHLAWHLHHDSSSSRSSGPVGEYFDLAVEADCTRLMSRPPTADAIVLLDNCDSLVDGRFLSLSDINTSSGRAIVFAGARTWKECAEWGRVAQPVKPIPLAVFLEKEARQIFCQSLSREQQACALTYGGTHPYMLKLLQSEFLCRTTDCQPDHIVQTVKTFLGGFFQRCVDQLRDAMEHQVLTYVIDIGKPVNPKDVAQAVGLSNIKPIANTLCYLGLISRWIRDEEATLSANSQLFNEWYVETRIS